MIEVKLFTRDNKFVTTVQMLPMEVLPEGIVWGSRFFRLDADGVYREGMIYYADLVSRYFKQLNVPKTSLTEETRVPLLGTNPNPNPHDPAPDMTVKPGGQHADYWVLSESERAKGFVRPVRRAYHHLKCGTITTMGQVIAETYAREPGFYGSTFCVSCGKHLPVGANGEFVWIDEYDKPTSEKVGT